VDSIVKNKKKKLVPPLYFIAVVPGFPLRDEVTKIKQYMTLHYDSGHALRSPPHVTLHMPFRWWEDRENDLFNALASFSIGRQPFNLRLENFGAFAPRVIYIHVRSSSELDQLQKRLVLMARETLKLDNAAYKGRAFHPHITVAFRDLQRPAFVTAWKEFASRKFSGEFEVKAIVLLKHDGKFWEIHKEFSFA